MAEPLVALHGIHKAFGGVHAVEDVSVYLHPGEVVALLGVLATPTPSEMRRP